MAGLFVPTLAGGTWRDRVVACMGALVGISLTGWVTSQLLGTTLPLLVASMGASSVLLFAVPASPMAQPWSIIGGNVLSAYVGLIVGLLVHQPLLADGLAVGLAIAVMSLTRSLHPPGGASALTVAMGGAAVAKWGLLFPLIPVGLNCCLLVSVGWLFHRMRKHAYPHVPPAKPANTHGTSDLPPALRVGFHPEDVDAALAKFNETFDIDREDLEGLLREIEQQALVRSQGGWRCEDIMSRDIVTVRPDATKDEARTLLMRHNIRLLPVVDATGRLQGTVGLRELVGAPAEGGIAPLMSPAVTVRPDVPAMGLLPMLTDGKSHAAVVTDEAGQLLGLVSQTDLLSALSRKL